MTTTEAIMSLINALVGLAIYTVKTEISALRELLELRIEGVEKRLDRLDK